VITRSREAQQQAVAIFRKRISGKISACTKTTALFRPTDRTDSSCCLGWRIADKNAAVPIARFRKLGRHVLAEQCKICCVRAVTNGKGPAQVAASFREA
jgi:hypothetical protein